MWPSLPALLASRQVKDPEARIPAPSWEVQSCICLGVTVCRTRADARLAGGGGGLRLKAPPRKSSTQSPGGGVRRGALGGTSDYAVPGSPPTGHRTGHWARADMEDSSTAAMRLPSPETSFLSRILPTHTTLTTPRPQVILGGYTEA